MRLVVLPAYTSTSHERGSDSPMTRLLGIDPGLRFTGWGVIEADGNRLRHIADGVIATDSATSVPERLKVLHDALAALLTQHRPDEAAIEETYVNRNGTATLKLGYARGVALLAPALAGVPVTEYAAKSVKLAVVGTGGAEKVAGADDGAPAAAGSGDPPSRRGGCAGGGDLPRASPRQPDGVGGCHGLTADQHPRQFGIEPSAC